MMYERKKAKKKVVVNNKFIYEKLGGLPKIYEFVKFLYSDLILEDKSLKKKFEKADLKKIEMLQTSYIGSVLGKKSTYVGITQKIIHQDLNLEKKDFEKIRFHILKAFEICELEEDDIAYIEKRLKF